MDQLKTGPIMIYMALMLVLCFGIAYIYQSKNKSINYLSPILSVEAKSSKIDRYVTKNGGSYLIQFDPIVMFHAHISGPLAISTPA